jgi:hypothetical protein
MMDFTKMTREELEALRLENGRHGSAWDRGAADSWYSRPRKPHMFTGATYQSEEIALEAGTQEWKAYMAGYECNERDGGHKEWD